MREIYQGLVSNPNNAKDNAQNMSITHTFGGTPVIYARDRDIQLRLTKVNSNSNDMIVFSGMVWIDNYVWYLDYADVWYEFVY